MGNCLLLGLVLWMLGFNCIYLILTVIFKKFFLFVTYYCLKGLLVCVSKPLFYIFVHIH